MDTIQEYTLFAMILVVYLSNMDKPPSELTGNLWNILFRHIIFLFNIGVPVVLFFWSKTITNKYNNLINNLKGA